MNETIHRTHFRGKINASFTIENVKEALKNDTQIIVKEHDSFLECKKGLMTLGLFNYKDMLFLYIESADCVFDPLKLFPSLSKMLYLWPLEKGNVEWALMYNVFYFAIPEGVDDWTRKTPIEHRAGRIAFLKPDTMMDYVYTHTALVKEGALMGEKFQSIALHENILFSYLELPRLREINVKRDPSLTSEAIKEWKEMNPAAHFNRIDPNDDFLFIDTLFDIG